MTNDASTHAPLSIDADLSESSYLDAASKLSPLKPKELIVSQANAVEAGRIAQIHGLRVIVLPLLSNDEWALVGDFCTIYTKGA
jgi:hypothetical protein